MSRTATTASPPCGNGHPAARRRRLAAAVAATTMCVGMMILATPAAAAPGDLLLASTSDAGVKSNRPSSYPELSADGTKVAFTSTATNLDPADTDQRPDIYVKDLVSGDIVLASTSHTGVKGNGESYSPSLSADGTWVAFHSTATNLHRADTDTLSDVYGKNLVTGDVVLASTSATGIKSNGDYSGGANLSADGRTVAFYSTASNLDPGGVDNVGVYVKDLVSGDLVSVPEPASDHDGVNLSHDLSADGSTVAFDFEIAVDPDYDIYSTDVYAMDVASGEVVLASASDTGVIGNYGSRYPVISADGRKVAFESRATNFDPRDSSRVDYDVYVKDLDTGDIVLASTSGTGVKGNDLSLQASISADGNAVAFLSRATNFDPADMDTNDDVYVKDLAGGDIALASISGTGVKSNGGTNTLFSPLSLSADGNTVAFLSDATLSDATNLDPADTDTTLDVYVKTLGSTGGDPLTVSIGDRTVREGDSGLRNAVFVVTLSRASSAPVTVDFATANRTATAGSDYRARSGTLTIPAGRTRATIVVKVIGDTVVEPTETFTVTLANPSPGLTIADGQGIGRIRNDD